MIQATGTSATTGTPATSQGISWTQLAEEVLAGREITTDEGLAILNCGDDQLLDLLSAAFRIRRHYWGKTVQLYFLMNAKSGLCPEDCSYCSQSKVSEA